MVTNTNLSNTYRRVRGSLVNQCTVKTTVLANSHSGVFAVPLIKCCTVAKTILSQGNSTIVGALSNICAITAAGLANRQS